MPQTIFIFFGVFLIWILHASLTLGVMLFVLRYVQPTHEKYVHYFSNYIWIVVWFFVFTLAPTTLVVGGLWPSLLDKATVLDGICLVDAQMYNALTVQSECIVGLYVRRKKIFLFNNIKNYTIILRLNGAYFHNSAALDSTR